MSKLLKQKAELMTQLATMDEAGLSPEQAIEILHKDAAPKYRKQLQTMLRRIRNGKSLAEAGKSAGIFDQIEAIRVNIAANTGDTARAYRDLGDEYSARYARTNRIRSRLMMPAFVLGLAAFVKPLPALFAGTVSLAAYLASSVGMLIVIAVSAFFLLRIWHRSRTSEGRSAPIGRLLDRLALRLPRFNTLTERREQTRFLGSLSTLLGAGLAMQQAVPIALTAVRNQFIAEDFSSIPTDLELGDSFTKAFTRCYHARRDAIQHLGVAEAAGTLPSSLAHFCSIEQDAIDDTDDMLSQWIPRVIHIAIGAWVITGIWPR